MPAIEQGSICIIEKGRKTDKVTVTKVIDDNFAMVKDEKGKEKKINVRHLHPLEKEK